MEGSAHSSSSRSWTDFFLVKRIRMMIPVGSTTEIKELCKVAGPVIISQLMVFAVNFVSTIFCGHLGRTELAGVSLGIAIINVTGISIGNGLAGACDTLISQTFGSRNFSKVGIIVQRAILILLLACFPCWAILINTEPILLAFKQDPAVASVSQLYVKIFMPALPATFMFTLETKYLQNQGIIWPQVITGFVVNLLNILMNYIFIFPLNLGVVGSALSNTISEFSMAGALFIFIIWKGLHKATWRGWSKECLRDWDVFIHLAIPSMAMMCVEWWTYEIGTFLAGLISEVELGSQTVVYQLANFAYVLHEVVTWKAFQSTEPFSCLLNAFESSVVFFYGGAAFPLGFSIAGNVRVGNALGAGATHQAKLSAKLTLFCGVIVSLCTSILFGSLKDYIGYIFTYDEQIRARVAEITAFYAPFAILDAFICATGGVIRGTGKQKVGALCNLIGYYGIGLPIGVPLMFAAKLGVKGLWTGIFTCAFLQALFMIFYFTRLNWKKVTTEAQIRAGVRGGSADTSNQPDDSALSVGQSDTVGLAHMEVEPEVALVSHRTLVLRRGLSVAGMLFILAAGIIINLATNFVIPTNNSTSH